MITLIILFTLSFAGIISMIAFKSHELATGKKMIFARLAEKTDGRVISFYSQTRTFISYFNKKSAVALIQWIAYHILSWARSFYIHVHRKAHAHPPSKKVIDMVRGRGDMNSSAGASFFLKRIAEIE